MQEKIGRAPFAATEFSLKMSNPPMLVLILILSCNNKASQDPFPETLDDDYISKFNESITLEQFILDALPIWKLNRVFEQFAPNQTIKIYCSKVLNGNGNQK